MLYNFGLNRGSSLYNFGLGHLGKEIIQAIFNICRALKVPFEHRIEKIEPDC